MLRVFLVLTAVATVVGQTAQIQLGIVDNKQAQYVASSVSNPDFSLSAEGAACIEASLLGLPCTSSGASAQAEQVLKPDIFTRPEAVLSLQVAGQPFDVEQVAGGRTSRQEVLAPGTSALQLSAGLQAVSSNAGPELEFHRADFAMMPGCSDACMEALLEDTLLAIGGNYTAGVGGPMRGMARVWLAEGPGAQAVSLDLQQLPVRLWAAEIAVLRHTASDMATEKARREAQRSQNMGNSWLLEGTIVGLQALSQDGQTSPAQAAGARRAVQATIRDAQDILSRAFNDRLVTQVVMLSEVPTFPSSLQGLLQWRAASLSATPSLTSSSPLGGTLPTGGRASLNWQTDAAAWLSFILIVAFLAAGIHCLTNMQFKKDSLLYGRAKAD